MKELHAQAREAYGSERLWHALRQAGEHCGRHRVRRLRREHGILAKRRRRYVHGKGSYNRLPAGGCQKFCVRGIP